MNTSNDLSHIYHRPGELFWLECDPFQRAVPCWQQPQGYGTHHVDWQHIGGLCYSLYAGDSYKDANRVYKNSIGNPPIGVANITWYFNIESGDDQQHIGTKVFKPLED